MNQISAQWGLLTYQTQNLGDDIQSLAALHHIPRADHFINRDDLRPWANVDNLNLIMNAWWSHYPENLQSLEHIRFNPLFISFHLAHEGVMSRNGTSMDDVLASSNFREILAINSPIGCRDLYTLDKLDKIGIPAYFSGCLTTTIKRNPDLITENLEGGLLLADLSPNLVSRIKRAYQSQVKYVVNDTNQLLTPIERLIKAQHALNQIQSSSAVITSRLHIALPALALGVPVVLVTENKENPRLDSFRPWLNTTDESRIVEQVREFSNVGFPKNPTAHLEFASNLEKRVADWVKTIKHGEIKPNFGVDDYVQIGNIKKESIKNRNVLVRSAEEDLYAFQLSMKARFTRFQGRGFRTRLKLLFTKIRLKISSESEYFFALSYFGLLHKHGVIRAIDYSNTTYLTKLKLLNLARSLGQINKGKIKGSIVECGVGLGGSSILLEKFNTQRRDLLMFDVFKMIPEPTTEDELDSEVRYGEIVNYKSGGIGGNLYYGYEPDLIKKVKENFEKFSLNPNEGHIKFIIGDVRSTLDDLGDRPIAFAHIDLDWYQGVKVSLIKLWKNLSSGGIIVIDDYWSYNGCKKATHEFLEMIPGQFLIEKSISFKLIKL
jgi:asparagine synthase (glutamine-hydrolysing)